MSRLSRVLRRALAWVMAALIAVCVFLSSWHSWQDARLARALRSSASRVSFVPPPLVLPQNPQHLLPVPREVQLRDGVCRCPAVLAVKSAPVWRAWAEKALGIALVGVSSSARGSGGVASSGFLELRQDASLPGEGYVLEIAPAGLRLVASTPEGAFRGMISLRQLLRQHGSTLPCLRIADAPSYPVRGLLLDISRDKIPTLDSLKRVVDQLTELKYNQLQLYVEGFAFAYPSFEDLWKGRETPITGAEIQELDRYCQERFIELVPNQNSLGHMSAWLSTPAYADLAECPEGLSMMALVPPTKTTLDPQDPRSLELLRRMTADLLPNFTSTSFNMDLDEPFELGKCKGKERAKKAGGAGPLYAEYVGKMHALAQEHGKRMQMWADMAWQDPGLLASIPKDVTLLEWGYEASHPFRVNGERLRTSGHPFMVCPGTSTWMSFAGRTENMMANVRNAAQNGLDAGASGLLLADWGDLGHWQYWPASYAGLAYGAALAWNAASGDRVPLEAHLNEAFFHDEKRVAARLFLELGRYNRFEETLAPQATSAFLAYHLGLMDRVLEHRVLVTVGRSMAGLISSGDEGLARDIRSRFARLGPYRDEALEAWLSGLETAMSGSAMTGVDAALVSDEFANTVRFIRLGARLKGYIQGREELSREDRVARLQAMLALSDEIEREHRRLWLARNRPGGLERSLAQLVKVRSGISAEIERQQKGTLARGFARFLEKMGAGLSDLLLRASG